MLSNANITLVFISALFLLRQRIVSQSAQSFSTKNLVLSQVSVMFLPKKPFFVLLKIEEVQLYTHKLGKTWAPNILARGLISVEQRLRSH